MKRRPYPNITRRVFVSGLLVVAYTAIPMASLGFYLRLVHDLKWAMPAFAISGVVMAGVFSRLAILGIYRRLPCPGCGNGQMVFSTTKDSDRWHTLTCLGCRIEWEIGIGDGGAD